MNKKTIGILICLLFFGLLVNNVVANYDIMFTKHTIDSSFNNARFVYACDVDGDNDIDVLGAAYDYQIPADVVWWENDGSESFTKHVIDSSFDDATSVYACDLDGDNDIDVLASAYDYHTNDDIAWWENDGSESFTKHVITSSFNGATFVYACDIDGDNDIDVLGAASEDDEIAWWENDGSESFTKHVITDSFNGAVSLYVCDFDVDNDIDVIGVAFMDDEISWWENDGSESFTKHVIDSSFDDAFSVYACDIDNDNNIDILAAAVMDDEISWWENNGIGQPMIKHVITSSFDGACSVYACDVDDDDDIDVLGAATYDYEIAWWENDGSESFTKHVITSSFDSVRSVYACDVDSDNDIDVLGAAYAGFEIAWWENNHPPVADANGPYYGRIGDEIILDGSGSYDPDGTIISYEWDLDDDGQYDDANVVNPTNRWIELGEYVIGLKVQDNNGSFNHTTSNVYINPPPVADANGPYYANIGDEIILDGSGSYDPDGTIISYEWDLDDDGEYEEGVGINPLYSWSTSGEKPVSLKVTNDNGVIDIDDTLAYINDPPNIPSDPSPEDEAINVHINKDLQWIGGDPNIGDIVTYDIYLDIDDSTPDIKVSDNQSVTIYDTGLMNADSHYYWQIIAWDNNDAKTNGPIWEFTTGSEINHQPDAYIDSISPNPAYVGATITFTGHGEDPDGTIIAYTWESSIDGQLSNQASFNSDNLSLGTHTIFFMVQDDDLAWSDPVNETLIIREPGENNPPNTPDITGPDSGETGEEYDYTFNSVDPDGDSVQFYIEWGDDNEWTEFLGSGEDITISHIWTVKDDYTIRVKAKDSEGAESDWATLEVSIPKSKTYFLFNLFLEWLFECFPILVRILL